jgi:hypothetical protein
MTVTRRLRVLGGLMVLMVAGALAAPGLAHARDRGAIGAQPVSLPGATAGAVTVDLDGDGAPEVVRAVASTDGGGPLRIAVHRHDRAGWVSVGSAIPRSPADPGAMRGSGAGFLDVSAGLPVTPANPVRLLTVRDRGAATALLVSSASVTPRCCTMLFHVGLSSAGRAVVDPISDPLPPIDEVLAIDLDSDDTDELVLRSARTSNGSRSIVVLARHAIQFVEVATTASPLGISEAPFVLGDTDGRRGDEVGLLDRTDAGKLARLSWSAENGVTIEVTHLATARLPREEVGTARSFGAGRLLVVNSVWSYVARWPAGGELSLERRSAAGGYLVGVVGSATHPFAVVMEPFTERLSAIGPDGGISRI